MTALLSRLQSAIGPSRELDAEIALANEWTHERLPTDSRPWWRKPGARFTEQCLEPPRYTESIDAALTLRPKGSYWIVGEGMTRPNESLYGAQIMRANMREVELLGEGESDVTPAIALLI